MKRVMSSLFLAGWVALACSSGATDRATPASNPESMSIALELASSWRPTVPPAGLLQARSPYLRSQIGGDVAWLSYTPGVWDEAHKRGRPVLVSMGSLPCAGCTRVDRQVYGHRRVVEALRRCCIPVKLDARERPEVAALLVHLSGQAGTEEPGLAPVSVVVSPTGVVLAASAHQPTEPADSWVRTLESLSSPTVVEESRQASPPTEAAAASSPDRLWLGPIQCLLAKREGKSIPPRLLSLAIHAGIEWGDVEARQGARRWLEALSQGTGHDAVGGAFFAPASTDEPATVLHTGKLVAHNALLLEALLDMLAREAHPQLRNAALGIVRWAMETMRVPGEDVAERGGGTPTILLGDSQAPDAAFYTWTSAEVRQGLSSSLSMLAVNGLGLVGAPGGRNTGSVGRGLPHLMPMPWPDGLEDALGAMRELRARRPRPALDTTGYAASTGWMVRALLGASATLSWAPPGSSPSRCWTRGCGSPTAAGAGSLTGWTHAACRSGRPH